MRDDNDGSGRLRHHPAWDEFITRYWRRAPFLFRDVLPGPIATEHELLGAYEAAYRAVADRPAGHRGDPNVLVYVADEADPESWYWRTDGAASTILPRQTDREFTHYASRMRDEHGFSAFSAHLRYNLQRFCPAIWHAARALLTPVFEASGFPAGGWNLDCYAGKYSATPFGVHRDSEDQFYLTPIGTKVMKLWTPGEWTAVSPEDEQRFRRNYDDHPGTCLRFEVGPTDVLYWPREYFHIGEADDFALSVQINLRHGAPDPAFFSAAIDQLAHDALTQAKHGAPLFADDRPGALGGHAPAPAAAVERSISAVFGSFDDARSRERMAAAIRTRYLALRSAWFTVDESGGRVEPFVAAVAPLVLDSSSSFRTVEAHPLLWQSAPADVLQIACNGGVVTVRDMRAAHIALECLAGTTEHTTQTLLGRVNEAVSPQERVTEPQLLSFLNRLAKLGAFAVR